LQQESAVAYQDEHVLEFRTNILEGRFEATINQLEGYFRSANPLVHISVDQFKHVKYLLCEQI